MCKIVDEETLWGEQVCRIWLVESNRVIRVNKQDLRPALTAREDGISNFSISYIAIAAKINDLMQTYSHANETGTNVLLAPMESKVIPLPHQIYALKRALSHDRVRYLLADEVGLGKTIEAGLIMRELKLRGLVHRTLVVAPKSLAVQWVYEMETHFNETFTLVNPNDLDALERLERPQSYFSDETTDGDYYNPWRKFSQAIVTMDAVKPLTSRKGWSKKKTADYNQKRFQRLINGNWDLIIVDESHRLAGSTDQVARYKLGKGLSEATPYMLLLSATPHQGKSEAFHRLMSLLDPLAFARMSEIQQDRVADYVIRTEKRKAVTLQGAPLFRPRTTQTLEVSLSHNTDQVMLYNAVTEYVKEGYNQAIKDHKPHIGFLMVLLQRIATSSTHAIRCTLERRLQKLQSMKDNSVDIDEDTWVDFTELDGQMQLDFLIEVDEMGRSNEIAEVESLLKLAQMAEVSGNDVKTEALMNCIYQLQGSEDNDQLKVLIFTEFVPTQAMLKTFLESRGIACSVLNGSMSMEERIQAQHDFKETSRVLIATDAGGEGLNLQFCNVVINYDLPWNPMRIEQRIGRVDRIGQTKVVRAINLVYENSVESRVREVLHDKLSVIMADLGIDKANDILDTSLTGDTIEKMFTSVIMENADVSQEVDTTVMSLHSEIKQIKEDCAVYSISGTPDIPLADRLKNHPLPHWIERMTINYLLSKGCKIQQTLFGSAITWPDGSHTQNAVFAYKDVSDNEEMISLEHPRVREMLSNLPQFYNETPIPKIEIMDLPDSIKGIWGLYEVQLSTQKAINPQFRIPTTRTAYTTVFKSTDGSVYLPTARYIWDKLLTTDVKVYGTLSSSASLSIAADMVRVSEHESKDAFIHILTVHNESLLHENERLKTSFAARRETISKIGLPEVKRYRTNALQRDIKQWELDMKSAKQIVPELRPLLLLAIGYGESNA
jgi:superfamily II DNA or RNA helicase